MKTQGSQWTCLLQAGTRGTHSAAFLNSGTLKCVLTSQFELTCVRHCCVDSNSKSVLSSKEGIRPCWGQPRKCWDLLFWLEMGITCIPESVTKKLLPEVVFTERALCHCPHAFLAATIHFPLHSRISLPSLADLWAVLYFLRCILSSLPLWPC